jgi:hypothetical protein
MSTENNRVIVRGISKRWINENFTQMCISFGGSPVGIPKLDADFVGLYLGSPDSKITHLGVVSEIDRYPGGVDFYLKALVRLPKPIHVDHAIRKQEYWVLEDFELSPAQIELLYNILNTL